MRRSPLENIGYEFDLTSLAQQVGAAEYTDCISTEG